MNRIYRLVWNAVLNIWVAVAENTRGRGKNSTRRAAVARFNSNSAPGWPLSYRSASVLLASTALLQINLQAYAANANDANVVAGIGNVSTVGNQTTINQTSQRLAIDWTQLSTGVNESLQFIQPNAQAIALNRITGSSPSALLGSLSANGQVFILNPNGVLFGAGSQVNVGGLVASTLNMSNEDFMAGNHVLTGSGGTVVNQGALTAANGGYIALLAPEVRNEGVISATLGTALLAAGNKITLNIDNGTLLGYSIDQGALQALAENRHLIQANGGQVLMSAQALDGLTTAVVNNTGVIEAKTIANKAGRILLIGDMQHGEVQIGGTLDASAPDGGDGGFIETSAANFRFLPGSRITTLAAQGKTGTWLLDPTNMTIAGGNGAAANTLYEDALEAYGTNVTIEATDSINVSGTFSNGDLNIPGGLNLTIRTTGTTGSGIDLTGSTHGAALNFKTSAGGSVLISTAAASQDIKTASVTVDGTGLLEIYSAGQLDVTGATLQTAGGSMLLSGTSINLNAATLTAPGSTVQATAHTGDITLSNATTLNGGDGGAVRLQGRDIILNDSSSLNAGALSGDVYLKARNIVQGGTGTAIASNNLAIRASGYIGNSGGTVAGDDVLNTKVNNFSATAGNAIAVKNNGSLTVDAVTFAGQPLPEGVINGITSSGGSIALSVTDTGGIANDLIFNRAISAAGDVDLNGRNIVHGGTGTAITADKLVIRASGYIGNSGGTVAGDDVLNTQVNKIAAVANGAIAVSNYGALTVDAVGGINGVSTGGGSIALRTMDTGGFADELRLLQGVSTTGGSANTITLTANDGYIQSHSVVSTVGANVAISAGAHLLATGAPGLNLIVTSGAPAGSDANGSNAGNIQLSTTGSEIAIDGNLVAQGSNSNAGNTTGNTGNTGGRGGDVTVTTSGSGGSISIGHVLANGGNGSGGGTNFAWNFGTGGNGGNITLRNLATSGIGDIIAGNLSAQGGMAGYVGNGGNGGTVLVTTATTGPGAISVGDINTWGGRYNANSNPGSNGGNAGNVTLGTVGASSHITFGNVDAHGGAGSLNRVNTNYSGATIRSGTGGNVSITATGLEANISGSGSILSYVDNAGCSNNALCNIGAAGNVLVTASNGNVGIAGNVNAKGGNALGGGALLASNGGAGGSVTVTAGGTNHNVSVGSIDATGGNPIGGGTAGASKAVTVTAADGYVQQVAGAWFNGATVAVTANRGIGAGSTAGDLSQRLGIIPVSGTARNATGNVATRAGDVRVIFGSGAVSLSGTQVQNLFASGDMDIATSNGTLNVSAMTRTGAGNIILSAGGGNDLIINGGHLLLAANGNIRLEAGRDVIFTSNSAAQTTSGDLYVSAGGNIQQSNNSVALKGNNLALRAGGYIGDGAGGDNTLDTSVNSLSAVAGSNIAISNNQALTIAEVTYAGGAVPGGTINGVSTTGAGNVAVSTTAGALTVSKPVSVADGTLALTGASDLVLNAAVSNATRAVHLTAGSGQIYGSGSIPVSQRLVTAGALTAEAGAGIDITADATELSASSTSGSINVALSNGGLVENVSGSDAVSLSATTGNLNVKTVSGNDVTLTAAAGAITDANGTANNITASTLTASARNGIALGANVSGAQSYTTTAANGDISIASDNKIDTASYTFNTAAGKQNISLSSSHADGILVDNSFANSSEHLHLTASAGNIELGSAINAAGLSLNASGSIIANNAINVALFDLQGGTFSQIGALPSFAATDFRISGGNFIRALGGNGASAATAYLISDVYGLQGMASAGLLDKNFKLANSINASGTSNWWAGAGFTPIGSAAYLDSFRGNFDGAGHSISNLTIYRPWQEYVGLFGHANNGLIQNVGLYNVSISGGTYHVGALVGLNGTTVNNSFSTGIVTGNIGVGGLVGHNAAGGTISNSYSSANVAGGNGVGGLVGSNGGQINNSYASGSAAGSVTGGLVGYIYSGNVTNSFWNIDTSGRAFSAGGTGLTNAQAMQAATYTDAGWSASNVGGDGSVWRIYEGQTGPLLRSFMTGLALGDTNVTYNGNIQNGAMSALAGVLGSNASSRNAGVYESTYYSGQNGYDISGGKLTIAKADLTISSSDVIKTYDGTTNANGTLFVTSGAIFSGDSASGGTFAFDDKNAGSGNKTVTVSGVTVNDGNNGNNYNVTYANNTSSTINKADLTLSTTDVSKTYDGTRSANGNLVATSGTIFSGDTATGAVFTFDDKNAGSGKTVTTSGVTVGDGTHNDNYNITYADNTGSTINQANLTLSTSNVTKTYDGTTNANGALIVTSGTIFSGDTASGAVFTFDDKNAGSGKSVTTSGVTVGDGTHNGNYNISYVDNTSSVINKADLTVTANAVTKTYDGTLAATGSGTVGTLAGAGDLVDAIGQQVFLDKNAGNNKTVRASGVTIKDGAGDDMSGNYNITYADNTSSVINKADLTLSTSDVTKTYDGTRSATGALIVTSGTVFSGDSASGGTFAFDDKNAGSNKTVTTSGVTVGDGTHNDNYNISYADNTSSTINQANLTLSTNSVTKTYDGTTSANGALIVTSGTIFSGDTASGAVFAFDDKNAGSGKTVITSGVTVGDGTHNGNYNITYADNTSSIINKADLTVTANAVTKTYDGTLAATGSGTVGTLAGAGDVVDAIGQQAFLDKNAGNNKTVRASGVTIKDGAGDDMSGNYNISYVDNTSSIINKADLTVTANAVSKTYDGTLAASGSGAVGTLAGAGDVVDAIGQQAFLDKNAGNNKTVRASGVTIKDGAGDDMSGNYNISYADNSSSTINRADLNVSANGVNKVYDGTAIATINYGDDRIAGDSLQVSGTSLFDDKNVGVGKTVDITNIHLSGTDAGNYNVVNTTASTSADITQKALVITANNDTRFADNSSYSGGNGVSYNGFVANENASVLGGALVYGGSSQGASAAGNYIISASGYSSSNYAISYADGALTLRLASPAASAVNGPALEMAYLGALQSSGSTDLSTTPRSNAPSSNPGADALAAAAAAAEAAAQDEADSK